MRSFINKMKRSRGLRPWFFYYSFYGSADRLFWGFGKKIKLLLHTFLILAKCLVHVYIKDSISYFEKY